MPSVPLERLVRSSLSDFQELRDHGLKWEPIARGLTAWRGDKGQPVTSDHLRAAYSRASKTTLVTKSLIQASPNAPPSVESAVLPLRDDTKRPSERVNNDNRSSAPKSKSLIERLRATSKMRPEAED